MRPLLEQNGEEENLVLDMGQLRGLGKVDNGEVSALNDIFKNDLPTGLKLHRLSTHSK